MADIINCQSCLRDEQKTAATVFCYNCVENMCADCQAYHRKNKASSNHKLSNNVEGSVDLKVVNVLSKLSKCSNHTSEDVKYLCKDHNVLCCNECAILSHRKCDELVSIAEECKTSEDAAETRNASTVVQQTLKDFEDYIDACLGQEKKNQSTVQDSKLRIKQELEQVKLQIEEAYQTLRKNVLKDTEETGEKILKSSSNRTDKLKELKSEVTALRLEADTVVTHCDPLQSYLHGRHSRQAICNFQESIQILQREIVSCDINLKQHQPLTNIVESISNCLKVNNKSCDCDLPSFPACDISIRYKGRKFRERKVTLEFETNLGENMDWPRSCLWIGDFIIVASQSASTIFLFNTATNKSEFTYQYPEPPWSMTSVDHETFAVCGRESPRVEILKIDKNQIQHKQSINTKSTVVGLSFDERNKQLICLSQSESTIYFLRLDGQRMYTVPVVEDLKPDLKQSYCLAQDNRTQIIYVSCCDTGKVLAITKEGKRLRELTHVESVALNCPWEVVVDADNNVYVCIMHGNYVLQCDKDLNVIRKLLQENAPFGISFNKDMTKIAVTRGFSNGQLKVYTFE